MYSIPSIQGSKKIPALVPVCIYIGRSLQPNAIVCLKRPRVCLRVYPCAFLLFASILLQRCANLRVYPCVSYPCVLFSCRVYYAVCIRVYFQKSRGYFLCRPVCICSGSAGEQHHVLGQLCGRIQEAQKPKHDILCLHDCMRSSAVINHGPR